MFKKQGKGELKMAAKVVSSKPMVSKAFCSSSQVALVVRKRPHVVYGGGFVVSDRGQKIVFRVDGCGMLGKEEELIVRDSDGDALLLIRRKRGIVEALNINKQWKGYAADFEGQERLVFSLKEPKSSCLLKNNPIRISTEPKDRGTKWDFEIKGYFKDKACCIIDSHGNIIAQVGVKEEAEELIPASKDLYHVVVKPGIDQAFIIGLIAVLDNIYDGSTRC